jgi:hypothetical protein
VPPIDRRRRRRRIPRWNASAVAGALVGALVLAVLVGGALKVPSQSVGYERAIDRSYAAQGRLLSEQSNRLDEEYHKLLAAMAGDDRMTLEEALDTLVRSTALLARAAGTAASPAPSGGAGADVSAAMTARADAMRTLRAAVDGLLGMAPLPIVGAAGPSSRASARRRISAAGAAAELAKVGTLLARSDRMYAAGRRALRAGPGHARLPSSVWSGGTPAWTSSTALSEVDALTGSPTLAAVHRVELVTEALALTPAPVPSSAPASSPGVLVVPPTGRIGVGLVVANDGNVAERKIAVRATVTREGGVPHPGRARRVALTAGSSVSVTLPPIRVVPGKTYTIAVSVDPPVPNERGTQTSDTISVRVAPPGPPIVSQLLPARGPRAGGTAVAILGSGFTWVSSVTFGGARARFQVVSNSQIDAVAPPGAGTVSVRVTNPGGASAPSAANRFAYGRS